MPGKASKVYIISIRSSSSITPTFYLLFKIKLLAIRKGLQIFSTITLVYTIGEKTQAKIKYSHKRYTDYLTNENLNFFFLSPTEKDEIKLILSSQDISKATGPYSIPAKVLKLFKNDISDQLADLLNLLFTTGSFPTLLKTAKVILSHKKESK